MKPGCAYKSPKTILNKGTGFLSGYSYSLNPYTGCAFGCSYCYVRRMPVSIYREGMGKLDRCQAERGGAVPEGIPPGEGERACHHLHVIQHRSVSADRA